MTDDKRELRPVGQLPEDRQTDTYFDLPPEAVRVERSSPGPGPGPGAVVSCPSRSRRNVTGRRARTERYLLRYSRNLSKARGQGSGVSSFPKRCASNSGTASTGYSN